MTRAAFPDAPLTGEELFRVRLGENADPAPVEFWFDVETSETVSVRVKARNEEEAKEHAREGRVYARETIDSYVTSVQRLGPATP